MKAIKLKFVACGGKLFSKSRVQKLASLLMLVMFVFGVQVKANVQVKGIAAHFHRSAKGMQAQAPPSKSLKPTTMLLP